MKALNCKTCKKEPVFPFDPTIKRDEKGVFWEYKFESKCDCPLTIGYIIKIYDESRLPNDEEMKPLIDAWNQFNQSAVKYTHHECFNPQCCQF